MVYRIISQTRLPQTRIILCTIALPLSLKEQICITSFYIFIGVPADSKSHSDFQKGFHYTSERKPKYKQRVDLKSLLTLSLRQTMSNYMQDYKYFSRIMLKFSALP